MQAALQLRPAQKAELICLGGALKQHMAERDAQRERLRQQLREALPALVMADPGGPETNFGRGSLATMLSALDAPSREVVRADHEFMPCFCATQES